MEPIVRIWEIDSLKYIHRRFIISLATAEMQSLLSRFSCLSHGLVLLTLWGPQSFRLFSRHQVDFSLSLYLFLSRTTNFFFVFVSKIYTFFHVSIVWSKITKRTWKNNYFFLDNFIELDRVCVLEIFL